MNGMKSNTYWIYNQFDSKLNKDKYRLTPFPFIEKLSNIEYS